MVMKISSVDDLEAAILNDPRLSARAALRNSLVDLGDALRRVRVEQGLSQSTVAELAHIDQGDISRLENGEGKHGPTLETLVRYAHAVGAGLVVGLVPPKSADPGAAVQKKRSSAHVPPVTEKTWVQM